MKENSTHITIVLDRSGSMQSVKPDTIGGFNTFLADQKAAPGSATLTLAQFDNEYEIVHNAKPINDVPALTAESFVPRGGTALLDAIGRAINETGAALAAMPESDRPAKVLLVILTDGQENQSREFSRPKIFEMITHQREKYGWEVAFIGANQDAVATGASLGVARGSSLNYAATGAGTAQAYATLSASTRTLRSNPTGMGGNFFDPDKKPLNAPSLGKP